ncbi:MAG TPA: TonB-dependent receptor [Alteraurantiacibacter sp.]
MTKFIPSVLALGLAGLRPDAAMAQDEETAETATAAAEDAFGEQVGIERIGLYNPNQSRGFDLQAASGAFRLDGAYYFPSAGPAESLLSGSSIRVGISATRLELPSPSGVITYRLREATGSGTIHAEAGLRALTSPVISLQGDFSLGGDNAILLHGLALPSQRRGTGEPGEDYGAAGIVRIRPSAELDIRAFAGWNTSRYQGAVAVIGAGDAEPPPLEWGSRYSPDWLENRNRGINAGIIADWQSGHWDAGASFIRSDYRADRTEFSLLRIDPDGRISSTNFRLPESGAGSHIWEARIARSFPFLGAEHRIGVAARGRETRSERGEAEATDGGQFTVGDPMPVAGSAMPPAQGRWASDLVRQRLLSLTYGLDLPGQVQLRLGAHANRHEMTAIGFDGFEAEQLETDWLASASLAISATPRLRLFVSYVSGFEESGAAPDAARNRGEVLPPVKAEQIELGAVYRLSADLNLIGAAFRIEKPTYGLLPSGDYALTGTVLHRGLELSLTGQLSPRTRILLGANLVDPGQEGALVDAGIVTPVAPGVSRFNATAGIEHAVSDTLSFDASLLYEGDRRRDSTSTVEIAGVPILNLGLRHVREIGGTPVTIRARIFNALGRNGYYATPGGPLVPIYPRSWQVTAAVSF